jgi:hypothetical protein
VTRPEDVLRGLFGRTTLDEFVRDSWGRAFVHASGDPARFAHLLPWPLLNDVLRRHRLPPPRLRLALDGGTVPERAYLQPGHANRGAAARRVDHSLLQEQLRRGATLVLDAVDELADPVGELAAAFEGRFRERFQVNAYAGFGTTHGFGVHWDDHDVFVLQVAGRKRWRVYGSTREHPLARDADPDEVAPAEPVWEAVLSAGDVLYLPRGCWHGAVALGEPTLHLSCGATARTGLDLLGWCVDELRARPAFRRDLPRLADAAARAAHVRELRGALVDLLSDDALDRYFAELDAGAEVRTRMDLPAAVTRAPLDDAAVLRWLPARVTRVDPEADGTVRVAGGGRRWTFAAAALPVLRALVASRRMTFAALCAECPLPAETLRLFVRELTEAGLVAADAP